MADPITLGILTAVDTSIGAVKSVTDYLDTIQAIQDEKKALDRDSKQKILLHQIKARNRTQEFLQDTGVIGTIAATKNVSGTSVQAAQSTLATTISTEDQFDIKLLGAQLETARLRAKGLDKQGNRAALNATLNIFGAGIKGGESIARIQASKGS